jgi:uncharacterized membrane protein
MTDGNELDREEALFLSIMYSFHAAAMQQMGKIANPLTGKVERDLTGARGTIDVLLMFQKKTEGNLTDRERRVLNNLVTELQLNYVDESQRAPEAPEGEAEAPAAAEPEPAAEPETPASPEGETAPPPEAPAAEEAPPAAAEPEAPAEEAPPAPKAKKKKKKTAGGKKKETD